MTNNHTSEERFFAQMKAATLVVRIALAALQHEPFEAHTPIRRTPHGLHYEDVEIPIEDLAAAAGTVVAGLLADLGQALQEPPIKLGRAMELAVATQDALAGVAWELTANINHQDPPSP